MPSTQADLLAISIIIPVRNEANYIRSVLEHLISQEYDPNRLEIFVIDGKSEDGTVDQVLPYTEKYENIRLLENPKRLSSAARNIGIEHARGDVVLIIDGHCEIVRNDLLQIVNRCFHESKAHSLGRPQPLKTNKGNAVQKAIGIARGSRLGHHPASFIYSNQPQIVPAGSVAVAYRREVFEECGTFDERFDACEDYEFNHRLDQSGKTCYFHPDLAVWYVPRSSFLRLTKQLIRYGQGRVRMIRKHRDTFSLSTFLPALFLVMLIVGAVLSWWHPLLASIYLGSIGVYVAVLFINSFLEAWKERNPLLWFLMPMALVSIHLGAGWGILKEFFFPQYKISSDQSDSFER